MSAPAESLTHALAHAATAARAELARGAAPETAGLLVLLSHAGLPPAALTETLYALAGLHVALGRAFAAAWEARGRAVIETTFRLHALLGQTAAQQYTEDSTKLPLAKPYAALLRAMGGETAWRAAALRWIDLYNQRLTLHRYSDGAQRRNHARLLFTLPCELAAARLGATDLETEAACRQLLGGIEILGDAWLATWDLLHAGMHAERGWNRIEAPAANQMGGFYGLGDEARPPTPEIIMAQAQAVRTVLISAQIDASAPAAWRDAPLALLEPLTKISHLPALAALDIINRFIGPRRPALGLLARVKDLLTSRGGIG